MIATLRIAALALDYPDGKDGMVDLGDVHHIGQFCPILRQHLQIDIKADLENTFAAIAIAKPHRMLANGDIQAKSKHRITHIAPPLSNRCHRQTPAV